MSYMDDSPNNMLLQLKHRQGEPCDENAEKVEHHGSTARSPAHVLVCLLRGILILFFCFVCKYIYIHIYLDGWMDGWICCHDQNDHHCRSVLFKRRLMSDGRCELTFSESMSLS